MLSSPKSSPPAFVAIVRALLAAAATSFVATSISAVRITRRGTGLAGVSATLVAVTSPAPPAGIELAGLVAAVVLLLDSPQPANASEASDGYEPARHASTLRTGCDITRKAPFQFVLSALPGTMAPMATVEVDHPRDGVTRITLNRPGQAQRA